MRYDEPEFLKKIHRIREYMSKRANYDVHKFAQMIREGKFVKEEQRKDKPHRLEVEQKIG